MSTPFLIYSLKSDGHMGISSPKNRKIFFAKNGINPKNVIDAIPAHSNKILKVSKKDVGKNFSGFDGLITKGENLFLALTCADCMPIAFFDPTNNSIALIHCGWRGLENGIIKKAISKFDVKSSKLLVYVGPHICKKHYVRDLSGEAKVQLTGLGVNLKNIFLDGRCTFEDKNLFSYKRGDLKERNLYLFTLPS